MNIQKIYLAGGCFWGTQKYIQLLEGVLDTVVGYVNGDTEQTCYEAVCHGSGHAEAVEVTFDSDRISLLELLKEFYRTIDPTSHYRQGMDVGIQYRTGIYYLEQYQKDIIAQSLKELQKQYQKPVVVENLSLQHFCLAEEYHQNYLNKNPTGYCHINIEKIVKEKSRIVDETKYHKPSNETLKEMLTPLQYAVTQQNETEPPFQNLYCDMEKEGIYVDITTGEPLFRSADKFQSDCGWPSFTKAIDPNTIQEYDDLSHNMIRTEVRSRCGNAHLGHVFEDGPKQKGGLRYCINSAALRFIAKEDMEKEGYGEFLKFL